MKPSIPKVRKKAIIIAVIVIIINLITILFIRTKETIFIRNSLSEHSLDTKEQFEEVMAGYKRSFQLFVQMMSREIENNPDPDHILDYLKGLDSTLLEIVGETYDGLYMYYQDRYLYSWDTPYSVYEESGYKATERPWYKDAAAGNGDIVFTPPYMSYANHYILTTISQLQPDGKTVFAYDIKMGDIQTLVSSMNYFADEQIIIFDRNGTVIGSTESDYLGGNFFAGLEDTARAVSDAKAELDNADPGQPENVAKLKDKFTSTSAFYEFRQGFDSAFELLKNSEGQSVSYYIDNTKYYGYLLSQEDFSFLVFVPVVPVLKGSLNIWLVPLLLIELLLIYVLGRIVKGQKNRELKAAYVQLGQTQRRLEIALSAAQKAAAVDELTGMMNYRSFKKELTDTLDSMGPDDHGILIMIDGDHFKNINDTYGHNTGDDVIKLTAQMIVGRIRTIDIASRLHGDEFAIFVSATEDYSVAKRIMEDINSTLEKEALKRNMPTITLSAGAVAARHGDTYTALSKAADMVLYKAKETHNGGFAYPES